MNVNISCIDQVFELSGPLRAVLVPLIENEVSTDWAAVNPTTRLVGEWFFSAKAQYPGPEPDTTPWTAQEVRDLALEEAEERIACDGDFEPEQDGSLWPDWVTLVMTKGMRRQVNWFAIAAEHMRRHQGHRFGECPCANW